MMLWEEADMVILWCDTQVVGMHQVFILRGFLSVVDLFEAVGWLRFGWRTSVGLGLLAEV